MKSQNLTLVDDFLIALGKTGLLLVGVFVLSLMAQSVSVDRWITYLVAFVLVGSIVSLVSGLMVRRRERRVMQLWALLQHTPETTLSTLIQQSHNTLSDIQKSVQRLNNSGMAHIVLDEENDRLYDGRLMTTITLKHECTGCGATTEVTANSQLGRNFSCSYCNHPFPVATLNAARQRRRQTIEIANTQSSIQHLNGKINTTRHEPAPRLSMPLFLIMLVLFWPAALFYAGKVMYSNSRQNEKMQALIQEQMAKIGSLEGLNANHKLN